MAEEDADEDMASREEVQLMIDEALSKVRRNAVHKKQLADLIKDRDERLEERFEEQNQPNDDALEEYVSREEVEHRFQSTMRAKDTKR